LAACDSTKKPCEEGSHATLTVGATALIGIGQAIGISLGLAIDAKLDIVGYLSIQYGVGGGATAGVGAGIQTGGVESVANATQLDGKYHAEDPTTVTIALGVIQPSGTIPGKGDNSGAGLAFSSARLGAGGGVFVTQQHTITTPVMRPFARPIATIQYTVYGWVYNVHRFARCQVACMP